MTAALLPSAVFPSLEAVITDERFPTVDLQLRRGRHIGRDDGALYSYLIDAQDWLEPLYQRFGADLIQQSDGYFYLLPSGERLGRRQLSVGEMLVGQVLALLYLDPASLHHGGLVSRDLVLQRLAALLGTEALVRALNPRRRKYDERVAAETVRQQVAEALRRLGDLGFIDSLDEGQLRLRPALMRFAEPVRGLGDPTAALSRLIAEGEMIDRSSSEELGGEDLAPDDDSEHEQEDRQP